MAKLKHGIFGLNSPLQMVNSTKDDKGRNREMKPVALDKIEFQNRQKLPETLIENVQLVVQQEKRV